MRNLSDIHYRPAPVFADRTANRLRMSLVTRTTGSHAALAARSTA